MPTGLSENLIQAIHKKYHFYFSYKPIMYEYKKDHMQSLVNALKINNYQRIKVWDYDSKLSIKNPKNISKTNKYFEFLEEKRGGNWTHLEVPFEELDIKLIINNSNQDFITFSNDYRDGVHLLKGLNFLIGKILEVKDFSGPKQTVIDPFFTKL